MGCNSIGRPLALGGIQVHACQARFLTFILGCTASVPLLTSLESASVIVRWHLTPENKPLSSSRRLVRRLLWASNKKN